LRNVKMPHRGASHAVCKTLITGSNPVVASGTSSTLPIHLRPTFSPGWDFCCPRASSPSTCRLPSCWQSCRRRADVRGGNGV